MRVSTYIRGGDGRDPQRHASSDHRPAASPARSIEPGFDPDTEQSAGPQDGLRDDTDFSGATALSPYAAQKERSPSLSGTVQPAGSVDTQSLGALAWLLDDLVRIPGLNVRVGLDAVIGLVPGIGDSIGTALSSVILVSSVRYRVPMNVLLRMALNILIDAVLGLVPGIGDVADAAHRANRKNYRLLRETVESGKQVDTDSKGYVIRAGLLVAGIIAALVAATLFTLWILVQGIQGIIG